MRRGGARTSGAKYAALLSDAGEMIRLSGSRLRGRRAGARRVGRQERGRREQGRQRIRRRRHGRARLSRPSAERDGRAQVPAHSGGRGAGYIANRVQAAGGELRQQLVHGYSATPLSVSPRIAASARGNKTSTPCSAGRHRGSAGAQVVQIHAAHNRVRQQDSADVRQKRTLPAHPYDRDGEKVEYSRHPTRTPCIRRRSEDIARVRAMDGLADATVAVLARDARNLNRFRDFSAERGFKDIAPLETAAAARARAVSARVPDAKGLGVRRRNHHRRERIVWRHAVQQKAALPSRNARQTLSRRPLVRQTVAILSAISERGLAGLGGKEGWR